MSSSRDRRRRRRSPLSEFGRVPTGVHHPCTRCFKPDTERGFVIDGDAAFTAATMIGYVGLDEDEAARMVARIWKQWGLEPDDRTQAQIRLCRGCAKLTNAPVRSLVSMNPGAMVAAIVQED